MATFTETFVISVEAYKTAQFSVVLDGFEIISNRFELTNESSLPTSAYFESMELNLVKGQMYTLHLSYAERSGPSKFKLLWESDSQPFEIIKATQLYNKLNSEKTPFLFKVIPAQTNQTTSTLVELDNVKLATVDVQETHLIYARDVFGNA